MTLYDFTLLDDCVQVDVLYNQGVYIGKRKSGTSIITLYQLEGFYVEVFYKKYRCIVTRLHCFTSTALLNPYLHDINVEELVKC